MKVLDHAHHRKAFAWLCMRCDDLPVQAREPACLYRHVGVTKGIVPELRIANGHVMQLTRPQTAAAALSLPPSSKLCAAHLSLVIPEQPVHVSALIRSRLSCDLPTAPVPRAACACISSDLVTSLL